MKGVFQHGAARAVSGGDADDRRDVGVTHRRQKSTLAQEVVAVDVVVRARPHRDGLRHVGVVRVDLTEEHLESTQTT